MVLPEAFNCPYKQADLINGAELIPDGLTSQTISQSAKENRIYVAGNAINFNIRFT